MTTIAIQNLALVSLVAVVAYTVFVEAIDRHKQAPAERQLDEGNGIHETAETTTSVKEERGD